MTYSNMSPNDILAIKQLADNIGMDGIQMLTLPTVPTFKGAASVVEIQDPIAAAGTIHDVLNGPRVTVAIANGSKHFGLARAANAQLDATSFNVIGTGSATQITDQTTTHIYAMVQYAAQAQVLANALGIAPLVDSVRPAPEVHFDNIASLSTPPQITVVLGDDFHPQAVTAALPATTPYATREARRIQLSRHRGIATRTTGGTEPIGVIANSKSNIKRPRHKKSTRTDGAQPAGSDGDSGLLRDRHSDVTGQ